MAARPARVNAATRFAEGDARVMERGRVTDTLAFTDPADTRLRMQAAFGLVEARADETDVVV